MATLTTFPTGSGFVTTGLSANDIPTTRGFFSDVSGAATETSTGVLSFGGIAFSGSTHRNETSTGVLTLGGIAFAATTHRNETSTGVLALKGIGFTATAHRNETSTGVLTLKGIAFSASAHRTETGTGVLSLAGIAMAGAGQVRETSTGVLALKGIGLAGATHRNETSTGVLSFAGIGMAGAATKVRTGSGGLALAGVAYVGAGQVRETSTAVLAFGGVAFSGSTHRGEASTGVLSLAGISYLTDVHVASPIRGTLAFGQVRFTAFADLEATSGGLALKGIAYLTGGARVAELDVFVVAIPPTIADVAEVDGAAVITIDPTTIAAQLAEVDASVVATPAVDTVASIAEVDVAALCYIGPCGTNRCQVWKITRRDGQVFAFTSLDVPIDFLGVTYTPCKSLSSTASESASDLKSVGNVELTGILDADGITDADLYSGLFDDAFVEIWVIPWDGQLEDQAPFRQAAGWLGKVTRGEHNFVADVNGPGARLAQAALVDFITPGCRWDFGVVDANGIGCPVDADALAILNIPVTSSSLRTLVEFTAADPGGATHWNDGTLTWQTGRNAGAACQVETVDFAGQVLSLWDLAPYPPAIGDLFTLKPGCPKTKPACLDYDVYVSFGGFPDVPGPDAMQSNADSLFT
jgi:uncharacterized phage protein (TIGR02218 family)